LWRGRPAQCWQFKWHGQDAHATICSKPDSILRTAHEIVGIRYDASDVGSQQSATEVLCYGTAVVVQPK